MQYGIRKDWAFEAGEEQIWVTGTNLEYAELLCDALNLPEQHYTVVRRTDSKAPWSEWTENNERQRAKESKPSG